MSNSLMRHVVGKWVIDPGGSNSIAQYGGILLDFSNDGRLTHTVHGENEREVILLTYRLEGDVLITNQPSFPREERTRVRFTADGKLVLIYDGWVSTYVRSE